LLKDLIFFFSLCFFLFQNSSRSLISLSSSNENSNEYHLNKSTPHFFAPYKDGFLVLRESRSDNNCLFHSIIKTLDQNSDVDELRQLIAGYITSNPSEFTPAFLGRSSVAEYCDWIQLNSSWGGGIELSILSSHYNVEIASVDVKSSRIDLFGEGLYMKRILLLYSGVHYDSVAFVESLNSSIENDQTVFDSFDDEILIQLQHLASQLKLEKKYTDVSLYKIRCRICEKGFLGEDKASGN
jgi:ubiquitin thioesterase OTU1